jgi:hydrogenase/urease accessory protein HupE
VNAISDTMFPNTNQEKPHSTRIMENFIQHAGAARRSLLILFLSLYPLTVFAHKRGGEAIGFASGFLHPISGLDHILAMVAVGMWGAQLGAPAMGCCRWFFQWSWLWAA